MGTANSKTTVDKDTQTLTQEEKRKSNPSRTLKMVIKPQEERTKEERNRKKELKNNQKTKWH